MRRPRAGTHSLSSTLVATVAIGAALSGCITTEAADDSLRGTSAQVVELPGCGEEPDAAPAPAKIWTFVTPGQFSGSLGGRAGADQRCQTAYALGAFPGVQCSNINIHAVLQVDAVDRLSTMATRFGISTDAPVHRAVDDTQVATRWNGLIDPNAVLLAPVTTSPNGLVWTGKGAGTDSTCNGWTSISTRGNSGDAARISGWLTFGGARACNNLAPLVCACW